MNILQMSISAGILILAAALIRLVAMDRLPKTTFLMLWGIAMFRLVIPVSFVSRFGVNSIVDRILEAMGWNAKPVIDLNAVNWMYKSAGTAVIMKTQGIRALELIWLAGAVLLALFLLVSYIRCHKEIRTAMPAKGNALIESWLAGRKTIRPLKILTSDKISTPLTYGIIKPRIVLPKCMDMQNELQLRYVLTHEYVHIKRFDALWKLILAIVLCFHWFNPAVWVLYILMNRDMEISCDEKVIRLFGERTRSDYAMSLIGMAERRAGFAPLYSGFSKNATEERILSIMKFRKTSVFSLFLALLLIAASMSVFAESNITKAIRVHGLVQTNSGQYSFDLDRNSIITVRDASGREVSTTTLGKDGKAVLRDGSGNILKKLDMSIPFNIQTKGNLIKLLGQKSQVARAYPDPKNENGMGYGKLSGYAVQVEANRGVIFTNAAGDLIVKGPAGKDGIARPAAVNGKKMGAVLIEKMVAEAKPNADIYVMPK